MNEGYIFYCEMLGIPLTFDVLWNDDTVNDGDDNDDAASDIVDLNDVGSAADMTANVKNASDDDNKNDGASKSTKSMAKGGSVKTVTSNVVQTAAATTNKKKSKSKLKRFFMTLSRKNGVRIISVQWLASFPC